MSYRNKSIMRLLAIIVIIPLVYTTISICESTCCIKSQDMCRLGVASDCPSFKNAVPAQGKPTNLASTGGTYNLMPAIATLLPKTARYYSRLLFITKCTNTRLSIPLSVPLLV